MARKMPGGFAGRAVRSHRRHRISTKRLMSYVASSIGDQFYFIGATFERECKNIARGIRKGFVRMMKRFGRGAAAAGRAVWNVTTLAAEDVANPVIKAWRSIKSFRSVYKEAGERGSRYRKTRVRDFFRFGWLWNKHLVARSLNYILPALSLGVLIAVFYTVTNLNFALQVTYNGHVVGYAADEAVVASAQSIIQDRIIYAEDDEIWAPVTSLNLTVADQSTFSTQTQLADNLLLVSNTEIVEATGLYIGGEFYGATVAPTLLQNTLDSVLQPYVDAVADQPNTEVRFVRDVQLVDGVYPESSILAFSDLEAQITSPSSTNIYHTVLPGETVMEIANANGITVSELEDLNPYVDFSLDITGDTILVAQDEPLLSVKTVTTRTYTEPVAYETIRIEDPRYYSTYRRTIVAGQEGERTITVEIEYENGVEVSRTVVSEEITREPVNQQLIIGSRTLSGGPAVGTGILAWPTASGYSISRGWTSTHFGIDIANGGNTPLYAAASGTVVVSQWTNSGYGYYIIIDHGNGMQTLYGHCNELLVGVGEYVSRGQRIALMGSTGNSTGYHVHFEVRIDGTRVPTEPYLYG